jgi:hypothetical protein
MSTLCQRAFGTLANDAVRVPASTIRISSIIAIIRAIESAAAL